MTLRAEHDPTAIHNERIKFRATSLNNLAITVFALGAFVPLIAVVSDREGTFLLTILVSGVCMAASVGLHLIARRVLGNLRA